MSEYSSSSTVIIWCTSICVGVLGALLIYYLTRTNGRRRGGLESVPLPPSTHPVTALKPKLHPMALLMQSTGCLPPIHAPELEYEYRLQSDDYAGALRLGRALELDTDRVFQTQWLASTINHNSI